MTKHHVDVVVVSNRSSIVQQLLNVVVIATTMILLYSTASRRELSIVGVVDICPACLIKVISCIYGKHKTVHKGNVGEAMTSHSITLEVTSVVSGIKERVSIVDERTPHAGIGAVTIVHHLQTVGVYLDAAIAITDPGWIDRGHLAGESPDVTCRCRATVVAQRVVVEAGIVHVSTDLQPFLSLIVSFQTSCKTLHITLLCDTLVF